MLRLAIPLVCVCSAVSLPAQDKHVPRGYGSLHGFGNGATWSAEKSRRVVLIDRAQFPWGAGNAIDLQGFRLRRAGGVVVDMASTQRTIRVRGSATRATAGSSTPVGPRAEQASLTLAANHGAATPTLCLDAAVGLPPRGRLILHYQGFAVPIVDADPSFPTVLFTTPLHVPADADTVVLDIEVETVQSGVYASYRWQPEEVAASLPAEYRGGFRRLSVPCLSVPAGTQPCELNGVSETCLDRCNASGLHIGAQFATSFRVGRAGEPIFAWIGAIRAVPSFFAGVACPNVVDPSGSILLLGTSDANAATGVQHTWGTIPDYQPLVGLTIGVQFAAYNPGSTELSPDGAAFSGVYELTIGPAPVPGAVQYRTIAAVCDQTFDLGLFPDPPSCATFDPFAPNAQGALADTPVLQLVY
jgi:hypothetical protein